MWRRLLVVALEDVGPGDPYGVALMLRAVTDKALRAEIGELKLVWYLVQRLAAAPKSRDLCDIDVWCELSTVDARLDREDPVDGRRAAGRTRRQIPTRLSSTGWPPSTGSRANSRR